MTKPTSSNEIRLTRVYDAPVSAVWDAWTDPEQVAQWWGPRGFTITTHSKDLRVGGHWRYTMHGPDGVDYPNVTTYFVVEPRAKPAGRMCSKVGTAAQTSHIIQLNPKTMMIHIRPPADITRTTP